MILYTLYIVCLLDLDIGFDVHLALDENQNNQIIKSKKLNYEKKTN